MFYQRVQKANSQTPVRQQNNRLFPRPSDNFKPLPAPTTPDGRINLSRLPTSDWMKNDPVLHRWAQEEAAANSSDTPSVARATDAAPPTAYHNETVNPELENLQVNSQTGVSPLPDGEPTEKAPRFQPILSRLPTSDWMKNDPVLQRWAQEEAAAKSSKTPEIPQSIQAKLTVSTPGDKYEQEADAMAAKVMAMPDRAIEPQQIASKQSNSTTAALQRAGQEDKTVSPELENRIQNATGGSPLPSEVRAFMEPRFGVDFSAIEVHTDSASAQMCKEVGAKAFAVGNRIYYGAGYAPGKNELTAHELTHTIQQGAAKRLNKQVWQLPEPQEMLVPKEINISPPHNNRQVYKFPREEAAPEPQKVEPTFNRVSRQIAVEELPSSTLQAKQFTNKAEPNFNKIQPHSAEQLSQTEPPQAKSYLSLKTEESRPLSVSQTSPQIQGNGLKGLAVQAAIKVLETALRPFGQVGKQVLEILRSAGNAFGTIASNPQAFLSNLVQAVQTGFQQFANRIGTHLQNGLIAWLTGAFGPTVSMPAKLDARGVVSLVLQVLGINYGRFRGLLANRIGPAKVERLEGGFDLVKRLARDGFPAAIQEMMQSAKSLETFQKTVVEGIRNWVIETVVKKAVATLVKTFTGFGAIANAIEGIYNAISFLIEKASQIQALVNAVRDSIGNIAAGQIGTAASLIESALARSLSLTINFLARFVGLGNVGERVREIIGGVGVRVEAAVNRLIDKVIDEGKGWLATAGGERANNQQPQPNNRSTPQQNQQTKNDHDRKVQKGLAQIDIEERQYLKNGRIWKQDARAVAAKVKRENPIFKSITVVDGGQTWDYNWVASQGIKKGEPKADPKLKVGDQITVKGYREPLIITEITPDGFVKAEKGSNKVVQPLKTYGEGWKKYNPHTSYKTGAAYDKIKNLNQWDKFDDARQVLNDRCHNKYHNPRGMEWHHIHEQSLGGPNSVDNLVLATRAQNQQFNFWFGEVQIANPEKLSLRRYLIKTKASPYECRDWGDKCLTKFGLKPERKNNGRGEFQILVKM
jgi:hypothetical protein